jgi:hypothetical protein
MDTICLSISSIFYLLYLRIIHEKKRSMKRSQENVFSTGTDSEGREKKKLGNGALRSC